MGIFIIIKIMMEMMNVEMDSSVHASTLRNIINEVTSSKPDVMLLASDGDSVWTHRMLLRMNSSMFKRVMEDVDHMESEVTMTVPVLGRTLRTVISLLHTGEVICQNKRQYAETRKAFQILGISMENLQFEWNESNGNSEDDQQISKSTDNVSIKLETVDDPELEEIVCKSVEEKERKAHQCKFCEKIFSRKYNLAHHIRKHHQSEMKDCKVKPKNIKVDDDFIKTLKKIKTDPDKNTSLSRSSQNNSLQCHLCEKVLSRKDKLNEHLTRVHGISPFSPVEESNLKKFQCKFCSKLLSRTDKLRLHINNFHTSC